MVVAGGLGTLLGPEKTPVGWVFLVWDHSWLGRSNAARGWWGAPCGVSWCVVVVAGVGLGCGCVLSVA